MGLVKIQFSCGIIHKTNIKDKTVFYKSIIENTLKIESSFKCT
jgi:hypothetical protein